MPLAHTVRALALSLAVPMLASCSALSALTDATTPRNVFELQAPADLPARAGRMLARDVIIEEPTTSGALQTDRIMIRPGALQAQYLPDVRWADPAPVMVQTLMLRALDSTQAFQYVGRKPLGPSGDFAIVTELIDFHAEQDPGADSARVVVRMITRIVRERDTAIVATRSFAASASATSLDDEALLGAFDAAAGRVISEFAAWATSSLGAG